MRFVRDHAATTSASGESGSARPLFLYVALNAIHDTLSVPAAYAASAEYASLLGNLTYAKRQLAAGKRPRRLTGGITSRSPSHCLG